ncbi:MAG: hypothetical protein H0X29_07330 [Parachlamydiaceae bacterium]|nr:hypothetical protein [Parachlamydiaceae bacterium]
MGSIDSTRLDMSLPPPGPGGDDAQYANLVIKAKTNKPVGDDASPSPIDSHLKAIFRDDVDSLAEAQELTSQLNINLQIGGALKNAKTVMQNELDNLDPTNPRVPILGKYIDICDKLLQGGSIPGVNFALGLNSDGSSFIELDADKVGATSAPKTNLTGTVGGNPWLAGNSYVAFMVNFMTLAKLMMENMMVESKAEINGLEMMYQMGVLTKDQILAAGDKAAEMHRIAGITAAVSAATTILSTGISLHGMAKNKMEAEPTEAKGYTEIGTKKPPDLNLGDPIKNTDGTVKIVQAPKYIEFDNKPYRNEPTPLTSRGQDELGYRYLPRGRSPLQENAAAGIKSFSPGEKLDGRGNKVPNPVGSPHETINSPAYNQHKVEVNPSDGKPSIVREKADVQTANQARSAEIQKWSMIGNSSREVLNQSAKSVEEFMKAGLEIEKAQADALKAIYETIARLISHGMDKASEGFKANHDLLAQLIQQLDSIRAKLQEAISASLRK